MVVGGVYLFTEAANASREAAADAAPIVTQAQAEQEAAQAAARAEGELPSAATLVRDGRSAQAAAQAVADKQNALFGTYGAPSLDGIPTETDPEPGSPVRELTEDERVELALEGREETRAQLLREATVLFVADAPAQQAWWPELDDAADLSGWSWAASGGAWVDEDGSYPLVWTLRDATGSVRATAWASYDPVTRKITEPTLAQTAERGE